MIVYCANDLMFETKIRATAEALGLTTRPTAHAAALQKRLDQVDDGRPNDPVAALFLDLDVADAAALITQVKAHNAAIPVIAFGSHVAADVLAAAELAGADRVMSRGQFVGSLTELLEQYGPIT